MKSLDKWLKILDSHAELSTGDKVRCSYIKGPATIKQAGLEVSEVKFKDGTVRNVINKYLRKVR